VTLRVAFAGTSDFSVPSLRACWECCDLALVITQPDKPGSRGKPAERPVADAAKELGVALFQPPKIREPSAIDTILEQNIDALVVASYGAIIPSTLLEQPKFGGINVHPSMLPRWRGAAPVVAAILAGDSTTGVCIMKMDAGLDTGPVYTCRTRDIGARETATELLAVLAEDGAVLLAQTLAAIENGTARATPQDDSQATVSQKLERAAGVVDWEAVDATQVDRMVRALNPWPGVTGTVSGREIHIRRGEPTAELSGAPGEILAVDGEGVVIGTKSGGYRMLEVQPAGKRSMSAPDFMRGLR
jgi:methionyl-tRNA formyltransferase